jgi:hypothetical protein
MIHPRGVSPATSGGSSGSPFPPSPSGGDTSSAPSPGATPNPLAGIPTGMKRKRSSASGKRSPFPSNPKLSGGPGSRADEDARPVKSMTKRMPPKRY